VTSEDSALLDRLNLLPSLLGERRVACAESCTAGRVAARLAAVGGASDWLAGGIVAYQTQVKRQLLGVQADSVVTSAAAAEMAIGAVRLLGAEVAVATTGVLGDAAVDGVDPGTVYIATVIGDDERVTEHRVHGGPDKQCAQAVEAACTQLLEHLHGDPVNATPAVTSGEG
jgi:PncC family amidohydrolase